MENCNGDSPTLYSHSRVGGYGTRGDLTGQCFAKKMLDNSIGVTQRFGLLPSSGVSPMLLSNIFLAKHCPVKSPRVCLSVFPNSTVQKNGVATDFNRTSQ